MSFISELRRRNVVRTAVAYLAASWLLIQIAETILPLFGFADTAARLVVIALAIGFLPALAFSWAFEWTPQGLQRDDGVAHVTAAATAKTWDRIIVVVLAMAVGLFAYDKFVLSPEREANLVAEATQAGAELAKAEAAAIPARSVAVLPFDNMSADPENVYFSDGLTDTLLHMLAQLTDLKVSARTSVFAFKDRDDDIRDIAETLGVAHVLEGSVQRAGDRVRVTAQLIRAEDGFHVWSQNYDRIVDDVFAIQDEVALEVAKALGSSLLTTRARGIEAIQTTDIRAFDLYLRAIELQPLLNYEGLHETDRLLRQALEIDPSFHDARITLARNNILKEWLNFSERNTELDEAIELVATVLRDNADDPVARGLELMLVIQKNIFEDNYEARTAALEQAIPLLAESTGDPFVRRYIVGVLAGRGRTEEALDALRDGLYVDPLNTDLLIAQAGIYERTGRWDEAERPLTKALELTPESSTILWRLGRTHFARSNYAEGLELYRQGLAVDAANPRMSAFVATKFYILGILEEGDYWAGVTRSIDPAHPVLRGLEIDAAIARGDQRGLLDISSSAVDRALAGKGRDVRAIGIYCWLLAADGRAAEALDMLGSLIDDIDDPAALPKSRDGMWLKGTASILLQDVMDEAAYRGYMSALMRAYEEAGVDWESILLAPVNTYVSLGEPDKARQAFIEQFSALEPAHESWRVVHIIPYLEGLRADPEVAAILENRELELEAARGEVLEMLERPEWQH
jgi:adenylate cyclase